MKLFIRSYFKTKYIIVACTFLLCVATYSVISTIGGSENQTAAVTFNIVQVPQLVVVDDKSQSGLTFGGVPGPMWNPATGTYNLGIPNFSGGLTAKFAAPLSLQITGATALPDGTVTKTIVKINTSTLTMQHTTLTSNTFPLDVSLHTTNYVSDPNRYTPGWLPPIGTTQMTLSQTTPVGTSYRQETMNAYLFFSGTLDATTTSLPNGIYVAQNGVTVSVEWN